MLTTSIVLHRYADNNDQASLLRLQQRIGGRGKGGLAYPSSQAMPGAPAISLNQLPYPPPYPPGQAMANGFAAFGQQSTSKSPPAAEKQKRKSKRLQIIREDATPRLKSLAELSPAAISPSEDEDLSETVTIHNFRGDPFFDLQDLVSKPCALPIIQNNRHTVKLPIDLDAKQVDRLRADSTMRVLLFCSSDDFKQAQPTRTMIAFPQQIEVKVNDMNFTANFKGLKNKPGSTKPADLTPFLKKNQAHQNNAVDITYALTTKKFYAVAILVKKRTVNELTERIRSHYVISKASVLKEMQSKAQDPDIVATSSVMSLKDPVSYVRINLPCRSNVCTHNQCFDASSFLQLQEQAPTWTCPICSKHAGFEALCIDQYVQEILHQTPSSIEQVTIEPDGHWSFSGSESNGSASRVKQENGTGAGEEDDEDSDDLVEIVNPRFKSIKSEAPATPFSLLHTPPLISREASSAPMGVRAGQKRKSEVIDLTLSDDDEEPVRPAKRQAFNTPNSDQARNGYLNPNGPVQLRATPADQSSYQPARLPAPQPRPMPIASPTQFNWGPTTSPTPLSPFQLPSLHQNPYLPPPLPPYQHSPPQPSPNLGQALPDPSANVGKTRTPKTRSAKKSH